MGLEDVYGNQLPNSVWMQPLARRLAVLLALSLPHRVRPCTVDDLNGSVENAKQVFVDTAVSDVAWTEGTTFGIGCAIGTPAGIAVAPSPAGAAGGCYGGGGLAAGAAFPFAVIGGAIHGTYNAYKQVFVIKLPCDY